MSDSAYEVFLDRKSQIGGEHGFKVKKLPSFLYEFQAYLVEWALARGRAAIFSDTGTGKTAMQLAWADAVASHANGRVLILTPLAVGAQTVIEAERFGIPAVRSRRGDIAGAGVYVTNYQQLHRFNSADFVGLVCDESSILKSMDGATQKQVTRFANKLPYRLVCSATPAPNDWIELGTTSEALGEMGNSEMLTRFFLFDEGRKGACIEAVKQARAANKLGRGDMAMDALLQAKGGGNTFAKLSYRVAQNIAKWRLKGHAEEPFWRWVSSWARACRKPSDLGFSDDGFELPPLTEVDHVVVARTLPDGMLFSRPAFGLQEEREERRRTLTDRVDKVAELVDHKDQALVWCHLNAEGDQLERAIDGCVQVAGKDSDEKKEDAMLAFARGEIRCLVTKPKIAGHGMNWQRCAHVVTFATHSWEQHYQGVRRCWRYGQKRPVTVDVVMTEGESHVRDNMKRKALQADRMFNGLVRHMKQATTIARSEYEHETIEVPEWLTAS